MTRSYKDLYPEKWIKPSHLNGRPHDRTVRAVRVDDVWNPRTRAKEPAVILTLSHKGKRSAGELILNKTRCIQMEEITGTDIIDDWIGAHITLYPAVKSGKNTIYVKATENKPQEPPPAVNTETGEISAPAPTPADNPPAPREQEAAFYEAIAVSLAGCYPDAEGVKAIAALIDSAYIHGLSDTHDHAMIAALEKYCNVRMDIQSQGKPAKTAHNEARTAAAGTYNRMIAAEGKK